MESNCKLCEELGNCFSTDDWKEMKFHTAAKHLHSYLCLRLNCNRKFTTQKAMTVHYQFVHRPEYKHNKTKIDAEIKKMGKLINKELRAAEKEAEAAAAEEEA